jgi:hypothetical protein
MVGLIYNFERIWKEAVVVKILAQKLFGGTEENYEKNQSGYPVFWPRFEPSNSRNHKSL